MAKGSGEIKGLVGAIDGNIGDSSQEVGIVYDALECNQRVKSVRFSALRTIHGENYDDEIDAFSHRVGKYPADILRLIITNSSDYSIDNVKETIERLYKNCGINGLKLLEFSIRFVDCILMDEVLLNRVAAIIQISLNAKDRQELNDTALLASGSVLKANPKYSETLFYLIQIVMRTGSAYFMDRLISSGMNLDGVYELVLESKSSL